MNSVSEQLSRYKPASCITNSSALSADKALFNLLNASSVPSYYLYVHLHFDNCEQNVQVPAPYCSVDCMGSGLCLNATSMCARVDL
jgi:hypothetical protein